MKSPTERLDGATLKLVQNSIATHDLTHIGNDNELVYLNPINALHISHHRAPRTRALIASHTYAASIRLTN
jgi:hypothetical protein